MSDFCDSCAAIPGFDCVDCGRNTGQIQEYYMVNDRLWDKTAGKDKDKMLCIGCLEKRLGRKLTPADFTDAPVNGGFMPQSARLRERLLG
jgi:hypothetical protein